MKLFLAMAYFISITFSSNLALAQPISDEVQSPAGCGGLCYGARVQAPAGCGGLCFNQEYFSRVQALRVPPVQLDQSESLSVVLSKTTTEKQTTTTLELAADHKMLAKGLALVNTSSRVCTSLSEAPPIVWREALIQRPGLIACDNAARPLLEQRRRSASEYEAFLGGAPVPLEDTFRTLFKNYADTCLQPLEKYKTTRPFQSLFGDGFAEIISRNVGTLVGKNAGRSLRCTASLVRISEAPKKIALLTAAHCIGSIRSMGTDNSQVVSALDSLVFTSLAGQATAVKINADVKGWMYRTTNELAVIPAVDGTFAEVDGLRLAAGSVAGWDALYLIGVNPVLFALANSERSISSREVATITLSAPCRVVGVDKGQLVHNCETEKEMSGSPIFVLGKDGPAVAAIHRAGDNNAAPLPSCGASSWPAINHAILLQAAVP